ncbi:hypothetical protein B0H17DRAFT_1143896 [Mycena rosella]|uniref:Uncharacterized protein n=1 Tax=Mycena rosella TaxID=1033263 RepID=A0AAD7CU93_MYCRO|nr:hypothetical protein B0H17DRAFT_1143896 [Mycena rosella]
MSFQRRNPLYEEGQLLRSSDFLLASLSFLYVQPRGGESPPAPAVVLFGKIGIYTIPSLSHTASVLYRMGLQVLVKTAVAVVFVLAALTPISKARGGLTDPRPSFEGPSIVAAVQQPLGVPTVTGFTQDGSTLLVEQAHFCRSYFSLAPLYKPRRPLGTPVKNGVQSNPPPIPKDLGLTSYYRFEPNGETCLSKCQAGLALNKDGKFIPETSEVFKDFCASPTYLNAIEGGGCQCLTEEEMIKIPPTTINEGTSFNRGTIGSMTWQASGRSVPPDQLNCRCPRIRLHAIDDLGLLPHVPNEHPTQQLDTNHLDSPRQRDEFHFSPVSAGTAFSYTWKQYLYASTGTGSTWFHIMQVFGVAENNPLVTLDVVAGTLRIKDYVRGNAACPTTDLGNYHGLTSTHRIS